MSQNTKYLIIAVVIGITAWYLHKHYTLVKKAA